MWDNKISLFCLPSSSIGYVDIRASFTVETSSFIIQLVMLDNKIYRASFTVETSSFIIHWLCWITRYIEHHSLLPSFHSLLKRSQWLCVEIYKHSFIMLETRYIEHHSLLKRLPSSSIGYVDNKIYRASFTVETSHPSSSIGYETTRFHSNVFLHHQLVGQQDI